jgi:hypothetical protein
MEIAQVLARDHVYKNNKPFEIFEDIAPLSDFKIHQLSSKYPSITDLVELPDHLVCNSGKFKYFDEMLPGMKKDGHRVLVFSQFVMMLDVIEEYLNIRGHRFVRLDGSTAVTERQKLMDAFTKDEKIFIFLLSTRAGGLGINLTAADVVFIHDIDFNPFNDKQAEDRCHRIGQTKEVTIYKLISEGTIEERMCSIASEKLKLEEEVTTDKTTDTMGLETDTIEADQEIVVAEVLQSSEFWTLETSAEEYEKFAIQQFFLRELGLASFKFPLPTEHVRSLASIENQRTGIEHDIYEIKNSKKSEKLAVIFFWEFSYVFNCNRSSSFFGEF